MPALRSRLRTLIVGGAAIALVTIGAGGTLAASTTPTVYACYNVYGQVAMASIAQCKLAGGGQLVQINAVGIPGPTGATGADGATGPTGPTGPMGALVTGAPIVVPMSNDPNSHTVLLQGTGNVYIESYCHDSSGSGAPAVGFSNVSGAVVYVSGPGFASGATLPSPAISVPSFTGQGTFQAAGANGSVAAIVTAISLGAAGCRYIVTH